jgi:hypothetical protein
MTTWNTAFEASPADTDEAKYGANKIRELKTAISERLELEMNFKAGTQPLLKAGICAVLYLGTTTEITALVDMSAGALAWDTDLKQLKRYSGSAWVVLDLDHGSLGGLTDDDHPDYLKLDKAGQTITEDVACDAGIKIDGVDISEIGDVSSALASLAVAAGLIIRTNASTPDSSIDVDADAVCLSDGTNLSSALTVDLTIDCTATGANGLDTGSLAAETWYDVYVIKTTDLTTVAGLLCQHGSAPTMPTDYTFKKLVGYAVTDADADFLPFRQWGPDWTYAVRQAALTNGSATSYTQVSLATLLPNDAKFAKLLIKAFVHANDYLSISVDGTNDYLQYNAESDGMSIHASLEVPLLTAQKIWYKISGTVDSSVIYVAGFRLNL